MPNWVRNRIEFPSETACSKIRSALESENCNFDFNVIVPMPESLDLPESTVSEAAFALYCDANNIDDLVYNHFFDQESELERARSLIERGAHTETDLLELGTALADNIRKHGYPTWYNWCLANWGTKWLPSNVEWSDNEVAFETPWSPICDLVNRLSDIYDIALYYEWADEDFGYNCGEMLADPSFSTPRIASYDGCNEDENRDAFCIASRLWDPNQNMYRWSPYDHDTVHHVYWDSEQEHPDFHELPKIDTGSGLLAEFHFHCKRAADPDALRIITDRNSDAKAAKADNVKTYRID